MAGNTTLEAFGALVGKTSRQMSANYAIESSGRIGLFCHEADRSWCSSSPWNDHRAITIEVANDSGAPDWHVSDKAYAALERLEREGLDTTTERELLAALWMDGAALATPRTEETKRV